ncbi:hypothetical protein LIER_36628 [Lithospermum erythrorhizon]|uniref:DUF7798 domain-containing protein n=1 Tax=Lithospermum erythrorhizon TaxID=34254 RepID=A0AAV3PD79_LITER
MSNNKIDSKSSSDEIQALVEENDEKPMPIQEDEAKPPQHANVEGGGEGGGEGWGGWGFLSDLQKAAEDISRNAVEVATSAAKSLSELQNEDEGSNTYQEDDREESTAEEESEDEDDKRRKGALEKLEKASEDNFLGQGLKALDDTVESFASGALQALGNALKGGSDLVQKLEDSAVNMADSTEQRGPPPSLIETGKALSAKGMEVLQLVKKETMDVLNIEYETGAGEKIDEDQFEEVNFNRCFYIYGGPEQLEELEALSSHYALLFTRRKAKLSPQQKTFYDDKLKEVHQIFDLSSAVDGSDVESDEGKKMEIPSESSINEMNKSYDSGAKKPPDLAAG